jgi:hypothetical protein
MTRNKLFAIVASLLVAITAAANAATPNTISNDATVNVGSEWAADELIDTLSTTTFVDDFGTTKAPVDFYVTFDATNLYIGVTGDNSDSPGGGNDGFIIYLDTTPGAGTNPGPFATFQIGVAAAYSTPDLGGSAGDGGPNVIFPDEFRPDFLLAARYNADGNKLPSVASGTYGPGMWSLSNLAEVDNNDAGVNVAISRNPNIEFTVPLADLYGGAPPANAQIGVLAMVSSRDWMCSRVFPRLVGTSIANPGQANVAPAPDTDPGLSGFAKINLTNAGGALLTGPLQFVIENTFSGVPLDAVSANQVFDANTVQVNFVDGVIMDNSATTAGNYTVTVNAAPVVVSSAQVGLNNQDTVYLGLASPIADGDAVSVVVSTAVTANGGTATLAANDTVSFTGNRRVLWTLDRSASGEETLTILGPISEPFIRGSWDSFGGRIQFSDAADAFPDIPGIQGLGTAADGIFEAAAYISAASDHDYTINSTIPYSGVESATEQLIGTGYWVNGPSNLDLLTTDTTIALNDDVWNRRLLQDTTVSFIARVPNTENDAHWANATELQAGTARLQGGTRLGGFSLEGVISPMDTGAANVGQAMQFLGSDGTNSYYFGQVTFPAGQLDVFEFRIVVDNIGGVGLQAYEDQDDGTGFVHLHTARATNFDRVTPNDQFITWEVVSYDVPTQVANVTAADDWDLFE